MQAGLIVLCLLNVSQLSTVKIDTIQDIHHDIYMLQLSVLHPKEINAAYEIFIEVVM